MTGEVWSLGGQASEAEHVAPTLVMYSRSFTPVTPLSPARLHKHKVRRHSQAVSRAVRTDERSSNYIDAAHGSYSVTGLSITHGITHQLVSCHEVDVGAALPLCCTVSAFAFSSSFTAGSSTNFLPTKSLSSL